jgi:glycosidase
MEKRFQPLPWVNATNVYEVNVRQYSPEGTFISFSRSLPRLKDMGVETLWFMPVTPISHEKRQGTLGSYYACSNYTAVNPEFGTLEDFRNLVQQAHRLGLKVIIDWVANHTGWDHSWTKDHPDYYKRNEQGQFYDPHGWADVIDLNYANQGLRQAMIESMKFWVRTCDIDGFRCDMAMLVPLDFWAEARAAVDSVKPLFWMAELDQLDNPDYLTVFDAAYTWTWMHTTQTFYQQHEAISKLDSVLYAYNDKPPAEAMRLWFTSNHDENTWNGTEYEKYGDMTLPLAVFSCTWNGIPMLYSGQELPNHKRLKFFEHDPIEWGGGTPSLQDFYRTLLTLHSRNPALRAGDSLVTTYRLHTTADDKIFGFLRKRGDKEVLVWLNFSKEAVTFRPLDDWASGPYTDVFTGRRGDVGRERDVLLQPWGFAVMER